MTIKQKSQRKLKHSIRNLFTISNIRQFALHMGNEGKQGKRKGRMLKRERKLSKKLGARFMLPFFSSIKHFNCVFTERQQNNGNKRKCEKNPTKNTYSCSSCFPINKASQLSNHVAGKRKRKRLHSKENKEAGSGKEIEKKSNKKETRFILAHSQFIKHSHFLFTQQPQHTQKSSVGKERKKEKVGP